MILEKAEASTRRVSRVLRVSRSSLSRDWRPESETATRKALDEELVEAVREVIDAHPTFGYRRIWAILRHAREMKVNRKAVYRVLRVKGWFVNQRVKTPRPRAQYMRSRAERSDERWAMDITHIPCGSDGWGHLCAIIDCHDRELIGYEFALRGRSREAERALESACIRRFGMLQAPEEAPTLRSDNGLVFQSRRFRATCRDYKIEQEYITPYTPEQNGMIERFFRSLKEECTWQHNFKNFEEASRAIEQWISWYNESRPHQALDYSSPLEFRGEKERKAVA